MITPALDTRPILALDRNNVGRLFISCTEFDSEGVGVRSYVLSMQDEHTVDSIMFRRFDDMTRLMGENVRIGPPDVALPCNCRYPDADSAPSHHRQEGPQMTATRYFARFEPQAWINNYAYSVDPQGEQVWDATKAFMELADEYRATLLLAIDEHGSALDYGDVLFHDPAAPEWVGQWSGPFNIRVKPGGWDEAGE